MSTTPAACAPPTEKLSPENGGNTPLSETLKTDFLDAAKWDELAAKLMVYRLPDWVIPCSPEAMRTWLDRLEMSERDFFNRTQTNVTDFMRFNPTWPLRAFVGLLLEMREAKQ